MDNRRARHAIIHGGPLSSEQCSIAGLASTDQGAVAGFLGVVRNHSHGRGVLRLEYECYDAMAIRLLGTLMEEAAERFDGDLQARVIHASGRLMPGEVSLVIATASAHRQAAFDACRHLLERIKQDLPVWKREFYDDGSSAWLPGS